MYFLLKIVIFQQSLCDRLPEGARFLEFAAFDKGKKLGWWWFLWFRQTPTPGRYHYHVASCEGLYRGGKVLSWPAYCWWSICESISQMDPPPSKTNIWLPGKSTMNESMYFLLKIGIFQPVMLVFRGVVTLPNHLTSLVSQLPEVVWVARIDNLSPKLGVV